MSDRLRDLLRQRALLQEHLSWLDREIAATSHQVPGAENVTPPPTPPPAPAPLPPVATAIAQRVIAKSHPIGTAPVPAEAMIEQYRVAPDAVKQDVRRGCFIYFAAAFVLLALGVVALYFAISSR